MPLKRKAARAYVNRVLKRNKRSFPYSRPSYALRVPYRVSRRRMGIRMPTYKFHRYVSAITANYASHYFDEAFLPFMLYPGDQTQTTAPIAYSFKFSDIANVSEFSNLFDSYMITGVACYIKLVNNPDVTNVTLGGGTATAPVYPRLWYAIDSDDANVTDVASLKEYGRVRHSVLQPNKTTKIYVPYPKIAATVLGTGAVRSAGINKPQWLDMAYTDIIHYGLKLALDWQGIGQINSAMYYRVKLEFKYYFRCKDTI